MEFWRGSAHWGLRAAWLLAGAPYLGCSFTTDLDGLQSGSGGGPATSSVGSGSTTSTSTAASVTGAGGAGAGGAGAGGGTNAFEAAVRADSPIAYFRFEETSGPSCANEIDGSPITCVYPSADVVFDQPGAEGRAHCVSDVEALTNLFGPLDFPGDVPFAIEFWVKVEAANMGGGSLFSDMFEPAGARTGTWIIINEDDILLSQSWTDGTHYLYADSATPIAHDQWVQVVLQHTNYDRLYLDLQVSGIAGTLQAGYLREDNGVPVSLGGFTGCIDEVSVYDYALSADRMAAHFAARANP